MKEKLTLKPIPADFFDRFPDGDYTVGRGADPRGVPEQLADAAARGTSAKKQRKPRARKRIVRSAAE